MPYIAPGGREHLDPTSQSHFVLSALSPGELNFQISRLVNRYIGDHKLNYTTLNEVIGVLECAKLEVYRRLAAPYEDEKIQENGDVYDV